MGNEKKKVLLIGYFGFGNPGDEAILSVVEDELDKHEIKFRTYGVGTSPILRSIGIRRAVYESAAVIFTGGNLLQNETSNLSLLYYLRIISIAKRAGVPVLFAASGIGRLRGALTHLTSRLISNVHFFGARTEHDKAFADSLGVKDSIIMPDVCFTLSEHVKLKTQRFAYIPTREDTDLEEKIIRIANELSLTPTVIPFQYEHDFPICKKIATRIHAPLSVPGNQNELFSILAECRFSVSDRLHGAIFSMLSHTLSFISEKSEKCRALTEHVQKLSESLSTESPLIPIREFNSDKIKELGAKSSEFNKLLKHLKETSYDGLCALRHALTGN